MSGASLLKWSRRLAISLLAGTLTIGALAPVARAEDPLPSTESSISSTGPLERIRITNDLNCDVGYTGDTSPEFYSSIACGTLIAVSGTLYGPAEIPAGGGAEPRTGFTPVSQTGPTGNGTSATPFSITTVVDLGDTGLRLTQVDTYVNGQSTYSTRVTIKNSGSSDLEAIVYRAGDCYVSNSDFGFGHTSNGAVACVASEGTRVARWIPITSGSAFYEASYSEVWARIGAQQPFPNTVRADENIDNGSGLSWSVTIPAEATKSINHLTAFSADERFDDQDGDGLSDTWETNGLDADGDGTIDVDLPKMGATPDHKDLFVEVDWMQDAGGRCFWEYCWGENSFAPNQDALEDVRAAFAGSPVTNPDGATGVRLHIDSGSSALMNPANGATWGALSGANRVDHQKSLGSMSGGSYDWSEFNALKASNFNQLRKDVFHYALYADTYAGSGSSGIAQVTAASFQGDSFLITDGDPSWNNGDGFTRRQESGTFMHEFGHTLSLHHGGGTDDNRKPNYQSIMSYSWQLGGRPLNYSTRALGSLDKSALDEKAGLPDSDGAFSWYCGRGWHTQTESANVDWNCSGGIDASNVSSDINNSGWGSPSSVVLSGYNDWASLMYDGGAVGSFGIQDLNDEDPAPEFTPADEADTQTFKEADALASAGDGTVSILGPTVLYAGIASQQLSLRLTNAGAATAAYTISLSGLPGVAASTTVADLAGYESRVVLVPVDSSALEVGRTYQLSADLTAAGGSTVLSKDELDVLVPDLSDEAVQEAARAALEKLRSPQDGLDESLRTQLVAAAESALQSLDADGDGVPDAEDSCPDTAANSQVDGQGCSTLTVGTPVITGSAVVGGALSVDAGTWGPAGVSLAYEWRRDGHPIATGQSYQPATADVDHSLTVRVTGSLTGYPDASADSASVTVAPAALTTVPVPEVKGTWFYGKTLTAKAGTWEPAPVELSYQWLRDGTPIAGATKATYKLRADDVGASVSVRVTGKKSGFATASSYSTAGAVRGHQFKSTHRAHISGTAKVGHTVKATMRSWSPKPSRISYQWLRDGVEIPNATRSSFKLTAVDAGAHLSVRITVTKSGYYTGIRTSSSRLVR